MFTVKDIITFSFSSYEKLLKKCRIINFYMREFKEEDTILILSTSLWNRDIRKKCVRNSLVEGLKGMNPVSFPKIIISYLGGEICRILSIRGGNITLSSRDYSGLDALLRGVYFLEDNKNVIIGILDEVIKKALFMVITYKFRKEALCYIQRLVGGSINKLVRGKVNAGEKLDCIFFSKKRVNKYLDDILEKIINKYASVKIISNPYKSNFGGLWPFYFVSQRKDNLLSKNYVKFAFLNIDYKGISFWGEFSFRKVKNYEKLTKKHNKIGE